MRGVQGTFGGWPAILLGFVLFVVHEIVRLVGLLVTNRPDDLGLHRCLSSVLARTAVGDWFLLVFGVSFTELSGARSTQFCWFRGQTRLRKPFLRGSLEPALFCLRFMTVMAPRGAINPSYGGRQPGKRSKWMEPRVCWEHKSAHTLTQDAPDW